MAAETTDTQSSRSAPTTTVGLADPSVDHGGNLRRRIGRILGVVVAVTIYLVLPDTLADEGKITAAAAGLMAVWWMTEAIPMAATALVPLIAFPVLGVASIDEVAPPYANEIIFLFMGGFMIALSIQRWNLHKRIALAIVAMVGTSPAMLIAGFMIATGFITMWVSNTATAVMMLPIGASVLALVGQGERGTRDANFATALMLGIAYAASVGSVATLIGTPPNALMRGYLADNHDITIGFGQWMLVGVPLATVFLVLTWLLLTKVIFPPKIKELAGGRDLLRDQLRELGPMTRGEWTVLGVFVAAATAWIAVPLLAADDSVSAALPWLDNVSDGVIAVAAAVALFLIPVDGKKGVTALNWETAVKLPWGILILFGGGLSLSSQFGASGLSVWIGERVSFLDGVPGWVLVLVVTGIVLLMTELNSNTATAAIFLPIMGGVAVGMGLDVMALVVPVALAATFCFMLPVATPPNAIVYASGHVRIGQMVRAGIWLNIAALLVILVFMYTLMAWVFGVTI